MTMTLSIICENTVGRPIAAYGEHGFSCLLQTPGGRYLFDTGRGDTLLKNLDLLGYDASNIDAIVLSHGHSDHCGGLLPLLNRIGPRPVYAHPQIFKTRYWQGLHEQRNISIPYGLAELETAGAEFRFYNDLTMLAPGIYFSGAIPRTCSHEVSDPHLVIPAMGSNEWVPDEFPDDAALAIETSKGLVVLLGCAHAGLVNTVEYLRMKLGSPHIHAIVGGTHLGPSGDAQYTATVDYLTSLDFDRLGVSHCTGQIRSAQLHARFPNKVFFANVGTSMAIT
jgi:7,8-dihydropterin-6-yl-methyl-4-(beta-D-ribofuranosyl)aminobenzene 5'-phosphate synthase